MSTIINCTVVPEHKTAENEKFIQVLSPDEIKRNYYNYLHDESRMQNGYAEQLLFPSTELHIVNALTENYQNKKHMTISGARTGVVGGAVPMNGVLLSTEHMQSILSIQCNDSAASVIVQPGVTLTALSDYLEKHLPQWFYPPDPTEKSASIGGTVAANASGSRSYKYGQTRHYVKRLRIALCDGTLLEIKRGDYFLFSGELFQIQGKQHSFNFSVPDINTSWIKNTAGYYIHPNMDLIDLFIGSEGTLGIITEIELELRKKPEQYFAAIAFFNSEMQAFRFVVNIKKAAKGQSLIDPSAIEFFDKESINLLRNKRIDDGPGSEIPQLPEPAQAAVFFEQECSESILENQFFEYDKLLRDQNTDMDHTWGAMTHEEILRLDRFRHALPETVNMIIGQRQKKIPGLHKISTDFVVPEEKLERMMHVYQNQLINSKLDYVIFGHIGENHLHVNILPNDTNDLNKAKSVYLELAREAVRLGGTISGEHGIGRLKKDLLKEMYHPDILHQLYQIKMAFDPNLCIEKGVIF